MPSDRAAGLATLDWAISTFLLPARNPYPSLRVDLSQHSGFYLSTLRIIAFALDLDGVVAYGWSLGSMGSRDLFEDRGWCLGVCIVVLVNF